MLNMQVFYKMLFSASKKTDTYFKAMDLLTQLKREQISALESDLSWQEWSAAEQMQPQA